MEMADAEGWRTMTGKTCGTCADRDKEHSECKNPPGSHFRVEEEHPACSAHVTDDERANTRLVAIVREFIDKHDITCAETIYQTDRVMEEATTLIEALCDAVGYKKDPDDD